MSEIVVTGAAGQLGRDLLEVLGSRGTGLGHGDLDVSDGAAVRTTLRNLAPRVVIHAAAATDVDGCERKPCAAWATNARGTAHLAEACAEVGSALLYVSTDYVFDGQAASPYAPDAPVHPLSAYGRSKVAGELAVQCLLPGRHWIVRTSWVFGRHGNNFPRTILRLAEAGQDPLRVVADQCSSPTYAADLARWLVRIVDAAEPGVYHAANSGTCSRFAFAVEILARAGIARRVEPITTDQAPRPAARPAYSVLDTTTTASVVGPLRPYIAALDDFLAAIGYPPTPRR